MLKQDWGTQDIRNTSKESLSRKRSQELLGLKGTQEMLRDTDDTGKAHWPPRPASSWQGESQDLTSSPL